jgi:uncharacterized protein DUF6874
MKNRPRTLTKGEATYIAMIVDRAFMLVGENSNRFQRSMMFVAIARAHQRMPLDLPLLARAPDIDLAHDVFGIMRHIDILTGELRDCFVPRTARFQHHDALD